MNTAQFDANGELIISREVYVECHGKRVMFLGSGCDAVDKFCRIVQAGIPGAEEVKFLWENNYLVTLRGEYLIELINKHYQEKQRLLKKIDPYEKYLIDCFDMS